MREIPQLSGEGLIDSTTTDDEMTDLAKTLTLFRHLKGVINLKGHHRREVYRITQCGKRVAGRLDSDKVQLALQGPHYHHLACNIVERHTEQGGVAPTETEEVIGTTG